MCMVINANVIRQSADGIINVPATRESVGYRVILARQQPLALFTDVTSDTEILTS